MILTIIVPMYNVEKYIEKCIESIIIQNWETTNYEILIVDDASPDNSLKLAQNLQTKYIDKIRIISQENKGLGGARNTGIKNAKGEYLFFLDSDDILINNELPKLVALAKDNNLDILEFAAQRIDVNYNKIDTIFHNSTSEICSADEYLAQVNFANSACNKLYRKDFLINNNLFFFEKTLIEDAPFNIEALTKAERIKAIDKIPVGYMQNPESITRAKRTLDKQIKFIDDSIKVTHHMYSFQNCPNDSNAQLRIKSRVSTFISGLILYIIKSDLERTKKFEYIKQLENLNLYPYHYKSNILIRDLFMKIINKRMLLNSLIKFS